MTPSMPEVAVTETAQRDMGPSEIADLSYRTYDGPLQTRAVRWWAVAGQTIRMSLTGGKRGYWIIAGIVALIYIIQGTIFYIQRLLAGNQPPSLFSANPYTTALFQGTAFTLFFLFLTTLVVGASSIAADNRANALLVYLSKPLTRADYLIGKWMGVFLLLAGISFVPAFLFYLFMLVAYTSSGFLSENPTLLLSLLAVTLLPCALHTSLIIGVSSFMKSGRVAGGIYVAFYLLLGILSGITSGIMASRDRENAHVGTTMLVGSLSVDGLTRGVAEHLYDITPQQIAQQFRGGRRRQQEERRRQQEEQRKQEAKKSGKKGQDVSDDTPPDETPSPEEQKQQAQQQEESDRLANLQAQKPPLLPILCVAGVFILLPIGLAAMRVRAVEIVRG